MEDNFINVFKLDSSEKIIGAKFILLKKRDNLSDMGSLYSDSAGKVETTLSMGLKGGLKFFSSDGEVIEVDSIHFDGYKHHKRHLKTQKIFGRMGSLPKNCKIKGVEIFDSSSDHRKKHSQDYDDCQFLQLTDVLVSGFRTILEEAKNSKQKKAVQPIEKLVNRWNQGKARMDNSRWSNGFCLSECYLENEGWKFKNFLKQEEVEDRNHKLDL